MPPQRPKPPEATLRQPEYPQPLPPPGRRKRRLIAPKRDDSGMDAWLITYADMITLLLCFFIIVLSVSQPSTERLKEAVKRMKEEFKIHTGVLDKEETPVPLVPRVYPYKSILSGFDSIIFLNRLQQQMTLESTEEGIIIELKNGALFDSGSAELSEAGRSTLMQIAETLKNSGYKDYRLIVEGHTDDVPVKGGTYPSNWELSAMRAAGVVRYLISEGIAESRFSIAAYGSTRPKEPNRDLIGRPIPANQAQNRRTVIRMEKPDTP